MKITKVIPSMRWINKLTGKRVSVYGACPFNSESDRLNWDMVQVGYTWECDNGTIGLGRMPAKTESEAIEIMNIFNNK